jgi:hypothetical protein
MIKVFHKKSFRELMKNDRDFEGQMAMLKARENATWPKDYDHVATVDTEDKERAFELTNSIDKAWQFNSGVTCPSGRWRVGYRSTSVGDVIVMPDGAALLCAGCGWDPLNESPEKGCINRPTPPTMAD